MPLLVLGQSANSSGSTTYSGIVDGGARVGDASQPIDGLQFHIANFHDYIGHPARWGNALGRPRMVLKDHGWRVEIDQQQSYDGAARRRLRLTGGFLIGHTGRAYRPSNRNISIKQTDELISTLHFFLAFLRGFWCGPIATVGLCGDERIWTEWRSWKLTPWKSVQSWFPRHYAEDVEQLFREFSQRWRKPLWRQTLGICLFWYVQANAESGSLEASIVSTVVALELLSWAYLVDDLKLVPERDFGNRHKFNAQKKIELLLNTIGAPLSIPPYYQQLKRSARNRRLKNGPGTLVRIRNALVHPTRSNRRLVARLSRQAKLEAKQLALSYLELSILGIFNYRGRYTRRMLSGFEHDAVVKVPWAPP